MPRFSIFRAAKEDEHTNETEALQLTKDEYLKRFNAYSSECFRNAYESESVLRTDSTGALSSSLAEDIVSLCYLQWNALRDYCTSSEFPGGREDEHEIVASGLLHVIHTIRALHNNKLPLMWMTLDSCCRAANDCFRMAEKLEVLWYKVCIQHPRLQTRSTRNIDDSDLSDHEDCFALGENWNELVRILSCDAVASAERTQVFIMRHVNCSTTIGSDFFSSPWERDLTNNQVMLRLIQLVDGYLTDLKIFLINEHLWSKSLLATCKALVCLYVRCIVEKADAVTRRRRNRRRGLIRFGSDRQPFAHAHRALRRMWDDVAMLREFFLQKADGNPTLTRMLTDEVHILELIHECLDAEDENSIESFVVVIHKCTGADALVTRHFLSDLWLLAASRPGKEQIEKTLSRLRSDLQLVSTRVREQTAHRPAGGSHMAFVNLEDMLQVMYEDRIAQGMVPACWTCVPKIETEDDRVAVLGVRRLTRKLSDWRWNSALG